LLGLLKAARMPLFIPEFPSTGNAICMRF
jgi:hypothetical protein